MKFYNIARFPRCIGAIDCTHIRIQSLGGQNAEMFRNRKKLFSINVQTVADPHLKIRDIVARWPGSSHDTHIFRNSLLYAKFENGDYGDNVLVGDSGYAIQNYLIKPLYIVNNRVEALFNESQIRTRNVVERQYGVWKRRFPALAMGLRVKLQSIEPIIIATAVLHNIACDANEDEPPVNEVQDRAIYFTNNVNMPNIEEIVQNSEKKIYDKGLPLKAVENTTEGESGEVTQNLFEADGDKKIWRYEETMHLINTIGSYYNDIINTSPKLRKKAWENILNTLLSFKIESTIQEIKKKWSNLVQTYNKTKDLQTRTGRGPTRFQFFDQIDAVIGMKPTNACNFSRNIGSATDTKSESGRGRDTAEASSSTQTENTTNSHGNVETLTSDGNTQKQTKKRKNFTMEYLKIKKEYLQKKDLEREQKALEKEEEKHRKNEERKEKSERDQKRLQLEERKVKALEAYVALKQKKLETA